MDRRYYQFIEIADERAGQFSNKTRARRYAKLEALRTGKAHRIMLTTTYKNCGDEIIPKICWAVLLSR